MAGDLTVHATATVTGLADDLAEVIAALARIDRRLARLERAALVNTINQEMTMTVLDTLEADVAAQTDVITSAVTLLSTLHQELEDAIASGDPDRIQAVADAVDANTQALAAAVAANTPAAPTDAEPTDVTDSDLADG